MGDNSKLDRPLVLETAVIRRELGGSEGAPPPEKLWFVAFALGKDFASVGGGQLHHGHFATGEDGPKTFTRPMRGHRSRHFEDASKVSGDEPATMCT